MGSMKSRWICEEGTTEQNHINIENCLDGYRNDHAQTLTHPTV